MNKLQISIVAAITLSISLSACSQDNPPVKMHSNKLTDTAQHPEKPTEETLRQRLQELHTEIKSRIGPAACTNSSQCGALAMGHKACGGPQSYLVYSSEHTDTTKLLELAKQHQQTSREINQLTGAMSDCMIVTPPVIICKNNRCQTE